MTKAWCQSCERFPARFRPLAALCQLPADAPGRGWDGRGHGDQIWAKHTANSGYLFWFCTGEEAGFFCLFFLTTGLVFAGEKVQ